MSLWSLKSGGIPPFILKIEGDKLAQIRLNESVRRAIVLRKEINLLLNVALDSTDFTTKKARIASADQKLSEVKALVAIEPRIRVVNLAEIEKLISKVRLDLIRMSEPIQTDESMVLQCAENILRIINESLIIADESKVLKTKISRLELAKYQMIELQSLSKVHQEIRININPNHQSNIEKIESQINEMSFGGIEEMPAPPNYSGSWNSQVAAGVTFIATMQLRTPLRILQNHGVLHKVMPADILIKELWEGVWTVKVKTFKELGINIPEPSTGTMASQIGQIPSDGGEFLQFLITVRKIAETINPIAERIGKLKELASVERWSDFIKRLGGMGAIEGRLFPPFINTVPYLQGMQIRQLMDANLLTANDLLANEKMIGEMKGIGAKKLEKIIDYCSSAEDKDCVRLENIVR